MPNRWRISNTLVDGVDVVHRSAVADVTSRGAEVRSFALRALLTHCADTPPGQRALREMYDAVYGRALLRFADGTQRADLRRSVIPALERAFRRGDLVIVGRSRQNIASAPVARTVRESAPPPPPPREHRLTWIEIELVNDDDTPVAYERYEVVLPDGSVRSGTLSAHGFARLDGIEEGNCTVTFPRLDQHTWEDA